MKVTCEEEFDSLLFEEFHLTGLSGLFGEVGLNAIKPWVVSNFISDFWIHGLVGVGYKR